MAVVDIELIIARAEGGATTASLRAELPSRRSDLAEQVPISLDDGALRARSASPDAYGQLLTAMVFVPALREAWSGALRYGDGVGSSLRLRLALQGDEALHAIRWELLRDPLDGNPLAHSERVRFSRFLGSPRMAELQLPTRPALRAVVAVANPASLLDFGLSYVDVAGEVARARQGLGEIETTVLDGRDGRPPATLPAIATALRDGATILYIVCHGALSTTGPLLWLEQEGEEEGKPVAGAELVQKIALLERPPLLVVLASCQGAGNTYELLAAVGPQLARAGVGAVLAMQGNVPMALVAGFAPRLFAELRFDGQIDRAVAAARSALPAESPWWMPALWMAVRDGALWRSPVEATRDAGVFQVPYPPNPLFRGRDAELRELADTLLAQQGGTAAVLPAIAGTGGIGKTQLASEFAHRYRDAFPGGVFWLNMEQPEGVAAQVAAAGGPGGLELPGWAAMEYEGKIAAVRQAWQGPERRLLVFDNLEEPKLLQEWRPTGGGTRVLITTRRGVWTATSGVQAVRLQTLARPESVRLLLAPRHGAEVEAVLATEATAREADAICEQVGDLPLALALAGAYLEAAPSLSLAGYRARLAEQLLAHPSLQAELDEGLPTRHAESVAATIALSYQRLNTSSARDELALALLRRMAQLAPAPIPHRLLVRLADRDFGDEEQAAEVDGVLRSLAILGMTELSEGRDATIHRLVAAYVREHDNDVDASAGQAMNILLDELYSTEGMQYSMRGKAYFPHIVHFARSMFEGPLLLSITSLAINMGYHLISEGDPLDINPNFEQAVDVYEGLLGPKHPNTAQAFDIFGAILLTKGKIVDARPYFERALMIREQAVGSSHPDTARSLNNLGSLLQAQGDFAGASPLYERALAIREQALGSTHPQTATSLNNLGTLLHAQGNLTGARPYYERALAILVAHCGPEHPNTQTVQHNLAALDAPQQPREEQVARLTGEDLAAGAAEQRDALAAEDEEGSPFPRAPETERPS